MQTQTQPTIHDHRQNDIRMIDLAARLGHKDIVLTPNQPYRIYKIRNRNNWVAIDWHNADVQDAIQRLDADLRIEMYESIKAQNQAALERIWNENERIAASANDERLNDGAVQVCMGRELINKEFEALMSDDTEVLF